MLIFFGPSKIKKVKHSRSRPLKKTNSLFILIPLIFSAVTGCHNPGSSSSTKGWSLTITLLPRLLTESADNYLVEGIGPGGDGFSETVAGTSLRIDSPAAGAWTINVTAYNGGGTIIGTGQDTVTLQTEVSSSQPIIVAPEGTFISQWQTENLGVSDDAQIQLPLVSGGNYNFEVDWGDGSQSTITDFTDIEKTHTYTSSGCYTVCFSGTLEGFSFGNQSYSYNGDDVFLGDSRKLVEISQWGFIKLGNNGKYFQYCTSLEISAEDVPDLSGTTDLSKMFLECIRLDTVPNMGSWDVSSVTNMSEMFSGAVSFNEDIGSWNVSSVTDMNNMFSEASVFNQDLNGWTVSSVTDMNGMFSGAASFDGDIGSWDVGSVTNMNNLFYQAAVFNRDIGGWSPSSVLYMNSMFNEAAAFNQNIGIWDVSNIRRMNFMFHKAVSFNQNLGGWEISDIISMEGMFDFTTLGTENYDALLNGWAALTLNSNVAFSAGASKYSSAADTARRVLIDTYGWSITDGGLTE